MEQQSREEIMAVFQDALHDFGDMKMLSVRCGISRSALDNIRSGRTKWPRLVTLETLMVVLHIRMLVQRTYAGSPRV